MCVCVCVCVIVMCVSSYVCICVCALRLHFIDCYACVNSYVFMNQMQCYVLYF